MDVAIGASAVLTTGLGEERAEPFTTKPVPFSHSWGYVGLLGVGLTTLPLGVLTQQGEHELVGVGIALVAVSLAIAGFVMLLRQRRGLGTLTLYDHGFVFERKGRPEEVLYTHIQAMSVFDKEQLRNGHRTGRRRLVRIEHGRTHVSIGHFTPFDEWGQETDNFGAYVSHLVHERTERAREALRAGKELIGKKWKATSKGIELAGKGRVEWADLATSDIVDDKVSLWRQGAETPFFLVSSQSRDAMTLLNTVGRELKERGVVVRPPRDSLGRLLFSRRPSRMVGGAVGAFGVILFVSGIGSLESGFDGDTASLAAGLILAPLGLALPALGVALFRRRVDFHELGIVNKGMWAELRLPFSQLKTFSYNEMRNFYNGAYTGSTLKIIFVPLEGRRFALHATVRGADEELELFREGASDIVAARLRDELESSQRVPWAAKVSLSKDGVHAMKSSFLGKGEPQMLSFENDIRYGFGNGWFQLFVGESKDAAVSIQCSAEGFFPGFALFLLLAGEHSGDTVRG